jgi:hypothetical protein
MKAIQLSSLLTFFCVTSVFGVNATELIVGCSVDVTEYCQGDLININWQVENGSYDPSNEFYIQLSDENGEFVDSYILGSFIAAAGNGTASAMTPMSITGGSNFHVRLISTSPYSIGTPNEEAIQIRPDEPASHVTPIIVCSDTESFQLQGGFPANGSYTGAFTDNGVFYPLVAGVGFHPITYEIENNSGCSSQFEMVVQVKSTPAIFPVAVGALCTNSLPFILQAEPSSGTWSGPGVTNNVFHPEEAGIGLQSISYTYQSSNGCSATESIEVEILELPEISFTAPSSICQNGDPLQLNTGLPEGGNYFGSFVLGDAFDPSEAGAGYHDVHYGVTSTQGCTNTATAELVVFDAPPPGFDLPETFCKNSPIHNLDPNPIGGTFANMETTENSIDPSEFLPGSHLLTYTIVTPDGCIVSTTQYTEIFSIPDVELSMADHFCSSDFVSITEFGTPENGQLTIDDVIIDEFIPSAFTTGYHNAIYYFEDLNNCLGMDVGGFILEAAPTAPVLTFDGVSLTAEIPLGAFLSWFLNELPIAQQGTGFIPSESGVYTAKVSLNGCDSEMSDELDLTVSSVQEMSEAGMRIYPVPFINQLIIDAGSYWNLNATMKLYDANARLVMEWNNDEIQKLNGKYIVNSNLETISRGTYVLILTNSESTFRALITK